MFTMRCISIFVLLSALFPEGSSAAHSRRRITIRESSSNVPYDRSITTFSPDGRLSQVEYAMEATRRGDPVVTFLLYQRQKRAFLILKNSDKLHRIDRHILLITTGLAGDGHALASHLRAVCQQHRLSYGEAPTIEEISEQAARLQHDLTKTSGARPLGCTAIVLGVLPNKEIFEMYSSDPGGVLEKCTFCVTGKRNLLIENYVDTFLRDMKSKYDDDDTNASIRLTKQVLSLLEDENDMEKFPTTDVWILSLDRTKRGGMRIQCLKSVHSESLEPRFGNVFQS
jgi:proteasome alpha subunit